MNQPTPQVMSIIGFAALEWAKQNINGSRHRAHYRRVIAAAITVHENSELYAAAPKMRRSLSAIAKHAAKMAR
jgi:hypothetical protein